MHHRLVAEMVRHYLGRARYSGRVRVFTREGSFARYATKRRIAGVSQDDRDSSYAMSVPGRIALIWIDVTMHKSIGSLANSVAHEVAHLVLGQEFPHGPAFDRRVRRFLRGGEL